MNKLFHNELKYTDGHYDGCSCCGGEYIEGKEEEALTMKRHNDAYEQKDIMHITHNRMEKLLQTVDQQQMQIALQQHQLTRLMENVIELRKFVSHNKTPVKQQQLARQQKKIDRLVQQVAELKGDTPAATPVTTPAAPKTTPVAKPVAPRRSKRLAHN